MARRRISVERITEVIRYGVTSDLGERAIGRAQADPSWRYPVVTINPDWTTLSVSKIPSITFSFPPNSASGPSACRLLKGGS